MILIKGIKEYEIIYKRTILEDLIDVFKKAQINDVSEIKKQISKLGKNIDKKASIHFGQPYFNSATIAGLYSIMLKDIASSYNIELNND